MKLYINDKYVHLCPDDDCPEYLRKDALELKSLDGVKPESLSGKVLLANTSEETMSQILSWIELKKISQPLSLVCLCPDFEGVKQFVKAQFRIIQAAGGLVRKRDKFLLIYRLGKWDLPKGKLERGEKKRQAAVREVEEECGIEAELVSKLCTTWHTYIQEGKRILKKTTWYNMNCLDDSHMEPQYVENIEDIKWMTLEQAQRALSNSYRSIQGVMEAWIRENEKVG